MLTSLPEMASTIMTPSNSWTYDRSCSALCSSEDAIPHARAWAACPPTGQRSRPAGPPRPVSESTCPSRTAHQAQSHRAGSGTAPGPPTPAACPRELALVVGRRFGIVGGDDRLPAFSSHSRRSMALLNLPSRKLGCRWHRTVLAAHSAAGPAAPRREAQERPELHTP
jgi:hypothetical protein